MENNHVFMLPCGVEAEVREMGGKQQRILTEQTTKTFAEKLDLMLVSLLVRVGSETNIDEEFIKGMLAADRKKCLVEARQFSMDFEDKFIFTYKYTSEIDKGEKREEELEVDLKKAFQTVGYQVPILSKDGKVEGFEPAKYKEYSEVKKQFEFVLPRSGKTIRLNLLDGKGEAVGMATKKKDRSSHTPILMRNAAEIINSKKGNPTPIKLQQSELDNMGMKDLAALRTFIKKCEGAVDSEIMFEHPEAEFKSASDKEVVIDLLGQLAFFFPSEAI